MRNVSTRQVVGALAVSLAAAIVILVVAVLPVEYGIDLLGTGRALGLVRGVTVDEPEAPPMLDAALTPKSLGPSTQYGAPYRVDRRTIVLGPYEFIEYKYHLVQGANMVFSWQATAPVTHDFHGAPDGKGPEAEVSVDKEPRSRAAGALTAAFTGMHGWYWENPGGEPITVELVSSGFFTEARERRSSGARRTHELSAPSSAPAPDTKP